MTRANETDKHTPWFAKAGAACGIIPISRFRFRSLDSATLSWRHEITTNPKLGPVAATFVSQVSCPSECPWYDDGKCCAKCRLCWECPGSHACAFARVKRPARYAER